MPFSKFAFGCGVRFLPDAALAEDNHTLEPKMRLGLFIRYHVNKAGQMSGDGLVIDCGELALAHGAREIHLHRVHLKEIRLAKSWPGLTTTLHKTSSSLLR